jgi:hypothetical protein
VTTITPRITGTLSGIHNVDAIERVSKLTVSADFFACAGLATSNHIASPDVTSVRLLKLNRNIGK